MRAFVTSVSLLVLLATPAFANAGSDRMKACAATWKTMTPDQKKGQTYQAYTATCMKGGAAAGAPVIPAGSTARCNDGTYISSKVHQGACSGHKGVAKWL
ncbi:MAG: DUF3761 domain-containing protein [Rhizomicrobium sp.]